MGLFDRIKEWAEDKVDDVEEALGDAGDYLKEKAEDIAGENTWASKLIDKVDDYIPSSEDIIDKATDAATDYVGDEIKGTWAEDAASTVKDVIGADGGDITGKVTGFLGEQVEGTWAGDAVDSVKDYFGNGDDAAPGTVGMDPAAAGAVDGEGMFSQYIKYAQETPLDPAASTMTADDLSPAQTGDVVDGVMIGGIVPPTMDPATTTPADDILGGGIVATAMDPAMSAPAPFEAPVMTPVAAAVEPDVLVPEPAPIVEEPVVEVAAEPTRFEASMAAADEVEASVDDMFADIA